MMNFLQMFLNWNKRIFTWLFNSKSPFLWLISIPLVIFCIYFISDNWEQRFRVSGMILELMGLITVVVGLVETNKLFSKAGIIIGIKNWFMNFPSFKKNATVHAGTANLKVSSPSCSADVTVSLPQSIPIDEKIALIEKELNKLNKSQSELGLKINEKAKESTDAIKREAKEREDSLQKIKDLIRDVTVGGIHIEAIGVWWIFWGIILATVSEELVCLIFCLPT